MRNEVPVWAYIVAVMFLIVASGAISFTWKECGWKTMLLGNGGFFAAVSGMCENDI